MTIYAFDNLDPDAALGLKTDDILQFGSISPTSVSVAYGASTILVTAAGRTVEFSPNIATISLHNQLFFADGSRLIIGDASANTLDLGPTNTTNDALFGGAGDDRLGAGGGDNLLQGNQGADTLSALAGSDTIYGGQDNDSISAGDGANFAQGNKGDDCVTAGAGDDTLLGGQGNDWISGGEGSNFLNGNLGNDTIIAGGGANTIFGEDGNDVIQTATGEGPYYVDGGNGDDSIWVGDGQNTIFGGAGNDTITNYGGPTAFISGGDGNDVIAGAGHIFGDAGDDTVGSVGGFSSNDTVDGGAGNDRVGGDQGDNVLIGGEGDDTLFGGTGADTLSGGPGANVFQFESGDLRFGSGGQNSHDVILDWSTQDRLMMAAGDQLDSRHAVAGTPDNYAELSAADMVSAQNAAFEQMKLGKLYVAVQVGGDVAVFSDSFGAHFPYDAVVLAGRSLADIDYTNFLAGQV